MGEKREHAWQCDCGGGHFLTLTWWPGDVVSWHAELEGYLCVEGSFRTSWRDRLGQAWRVLRVGHSDTRVGLVLDRGKAFAAAAALLEFAQAAPPRPGSEAHGAS